MRIKKTKYITITRNPTKIMFRGKKISIIKKTLSSALRNKKPWHIMVYGKSGVGKTAVVMKAVKDFTGKERNVKTAYVDCKYAEPSFKISKNKFNIVVLDNIDKIKSINSYLANLLHDCNVLVIGITLDLMFTGHLSEKNRMNFNHKEIILPPYTAMQIHSILKNSGLIVLKENSIERIALKMLACFTARIHGDINVAIRILTLADQIASRKKEMRISEQSVRIANNHYYPGYS